jgi:hypothetical protein
MERHIEWRRLLALLLRDTVIVALTVGLWALALRSNVDGVAGVTLAILTAVATAVVGYLAHEWGHLLGALASRSTFALPATPFESFFLFRFDRERNTRAQFFTMALGGFAASLLTVVLLVALLPRGPLATTLSLAIVGLGVLATLVIEVPEFWRVWRGGPLPDGAAFVSGGVAPGDRPR